MFKFLFIGVIVLGVGVGAAFGAGTAYGRSSTPQAAKTTVVTTGNPSAAAGASGQGGFASGQAGQAGRPMTAGAIDTVTGNSFTVKTNSGTTTVTVDDKTIIRKTVDGSVKDLTSGENVVVVGTAGSDGTVAATSISLGDNSLRQGQMGTGQAQPSGQGQAGGRPGQGGASADLRTIERV